MIWGFRDLFLKSPNHYIPFLASSFPDLSITVIIPALLLPYRLFAPFQIVKSDELSPDSGRFRPLEAQTIAHV